MPKTKLQKGEILRDLAAKIEKSKSIVFTQFDKLGVKENEELRNKLKEENSEYMVAKKTLMDIAFKNEKIKNLNIKDMDGRVAAVFGYEDEVAPAKIVNGFIKGREEKVSFLGGILEGKFLSKQARIVCQGGGIAQCPNIRICKCFSRKY